MRTRQSADVEGLALKLHQHQTQWLRNAGEQLAKVFCFEIEKKNAI